MYSGRLCLSFFRWKAEPASFISVAAGVAAFWHKYVRGACFSISLWKSCSYGREARGQAWRKVKNVEKYRKMADCAARMLTKLGGLLYNEIYSDCDVIKTDSDLRSFLAGRYQVME